MIGNIHQALCWEEATEQRNAMRIIFLVFSILILASCSDSLDIQLEPEVDLFLGEGIEEKIRLTEKDEAYTELKAWLHQHASDWYTTSGYYPGGIYIKSGKHGIQITNKHVVLYSTVAPKPKAIYIQKRETDELSEIRKIGK